MALLRAQPKKSHRFGQSHLIAQAGNNPQLPSNVDELGSNPMQLSTQTNAAQKSSD